MLTEKLLKMASHLIMMVIMARVLSPSDLGQLMYCFALASIFIFLNQLGLDTLLIKKFIDHSQKKQSLLWHALSARLIAAIICILLANLAGFWLVESQHRTMFFVISLYHLFLPFSTFEWFYQAQGRSELSAIGLISGHIAGFALRLWCVLTSADLLTLASAYVVEVAITASVYLFMSRKQGISLPRYISLNRIQNMTKEAIPLMVSGAVILLYMKVDQLMLGYFSSHEEVAYYVAATRLSEAWFFLGLTIISVYLPKILSESKSGIVDFNLGITKLAKNIFWLGIALASVTSLFSTTIINILYGDKYSTASVVLAVSIFSVPFVYLGAISTRISIERNDKRIIVTRAFTSLLVNIVLNLFAIPMYGAVGAAISSLISQILSGFLTQLIIQRKSGYYSEMLKSIFYLWRFR